jgi:hypothetical protein
MSKPNAAAAVAPVAANPDDKKSYIVVSPLKLDGKMYLPSPADDENKITVELTAAEAAILIAENGVAEK